MVNRSVQLDEIYGALASPARRHMLRRLAAGEASVAELGAPLTMSAPAVSRHLRVLEAAGLVDRSRQGRTHCIRLRREALRPASAWLTEFWRSAFDALEAHLAAEGEQT